MNPSSPNASNERGSAVVDVSHVVKSFPIDRRSRTMFQLVRRLVSGARRHRLDRFVALDDVTLRVAHGDRVGVIGDNGAGKTTLLKTIAGLYAPDSGHVQVNGSMTLVSGLAIGMIEDLTVVENIALYGAIYGVDRNRLEQEQREILDWAEISAFADTKLKRLSTGMKTRLAFSVTRHLNADLFLLDEALTAGDRHFQAKCDVVFEGYRTSGKTFVISTHDSGFVTSFCTHALWLHKSHVVAFGDPAEVVGQYLAVK